MFSVCCLIVMHRFLQAAYKSHGNSDRNSLQLIQYLMQHIYCDLEYIIQMQYICNLNSQNTVRTMHVITHLMQGYSFNLYIKLNNILLTTNKGNAMPYLVMQRA